MSDIRNLEIDLDIKQKLLVTVNCKQLDNLSLKFNIWDNGQVAYLSNYKCRLKALKSDQIPLIQNTDIDVSGNEVTVEADEQLTTTSGIVKTELQFIDKITGKKKTSFDLNIKVISSTLESDRTISKATVTLLEKLDNKLDQIEDIGNILDEAKTIKTGLETDITTANTSKSNLEIATTNANNKKQEVNTTITNATNKITEVNTSISNATISKNDLDTSKANADTSKTNLDSANIQAETNIEALNALGDVTNLAQQVQTNKDNIDELNLNKTNILKKIGNISVETDGDIATQLNANTQDITTHKNALVTESGGIHGLKIESGVWTPILIGETTSGTNTYTKQIGSYYKIGNLVHCEFWIETSDVDSNMSGTLTIAGLPFSVKNTYIPGASIGNLGIGKSFSDIYQISLIGVGNTLSFRCHKAIDGSIFALTPSFIGKVFKISASIDYQI